MITGKQLCLSDKILIDNQHKSRLKNHPHSTKAKARVQKYHHSADIAVGSLVYIINDGDKTQSREKYIVTSINDEWCQIRKLSHNQFRTKVYDMKLSEVFPVTKQAGSTEMNVVIESDTDSSDYESVVVPVKNEQNIDSDENENPDPLRRSTRERRRPDYYNNPVSDF